MRYRSICWLLAAALLALAPIARAAGPDLKPGLWERTVTLQSGLPAMSGLPELGALPPAQRAQIEKLAAAMAGKPTIVRECVTPAMTKEWERYARDRTEQGCTSKITEQTAERVAMAISCEDGASTGTLEFVAQGPERMTGTMSMLRRKDGAEQRVSMKMDSRWLRAECDTPKPVAPQPAQPPQTQRTP